MPQKTRSKRVLVIGGGPAGLSAAIAAAREGAQVYIAERSDRVGKKLLATGNGRCNLSNTSIKQENYHGTGRETAYSIIRKAGDGFVTEFFMKLGVYTAVEDGARVYPRTYSAVTVLDALRSGAARLGVKELTGYDAESISRRGGLFITRFRSKAEIESDCVVVATGGAAEVGGASANRSAAGYSLLSSFGHEIMPPKPALVQLRLAQRGIRGLKGVRLRARVSLVFVHPLKSGGDTRVCYSKTGELLFTDYGVSGIPVFNMSARLSNCLFADENTHEFKLPAGYTLSVDLLPEYTYAEVKRILLDQTYYKPDAGYNEILSGILHKRVAYLIYERASDAKRVSVSKRAQDMIGCGENPGPVGADIKIRIANELKNWDHDIVGAMGFNNAQAIYGGVSMDGFDSDSLCSKLAPGLFAAGEALDVTGDCGGYNLHWAWVSGCVAGYNAARI